MRFRVYVPNLEKRSHLIIRDGSGIVGVAASPVMGGPDRLMIDYEGAIYGQDMRYAEKVLHAAGRQATKYPTIARAWVLPETMTAVGWFYDDIGIVEPEDVEATRRIATWLGITPDDLIANEKTILRARGMKWGRI